MDSRRERSQGFVMGVCAGEKGEGRERTERQRENGGRERERKRLATNGDELGLCLMSCNPSVSGCVYKFTSQEFESKGRYGRYGQQSHAAQHLGPPSPLTLSTLACAALEQTRAPARPCAHQSANRPSLMVVIPTCAFINRATF